jgi:hypothetical protein
VASTVPLYVASVLVALWGAHLIATRKVVSGFESKANASLSNWSSPNHGDHIATHSPCTSSPVSPTANHVPSVATNGSEQMTLTEADLSGSQRTYGSGQLCCGVER